MPHDTVARCIACDAKIYIRFEGTIERTLALYLAALALFLVANAFPIMSMAIAGQTNASTILDSAKALYDAGMWPLALAVGLAGCVIPLAKILGMLAVLIPLQLGRQPSWVFGGFRWVERFRPWAMMEVYLLGVIVAYVKMQDLATVHVGIAMYAFIGTIVLLAAGDARFDPHAVWRRLAAQAGDDVLAPRPGTVLLACEACDQVVRAEAAHLHGLDCPRCGEALHRRKPDSLNRTWALALTAAPVQAVDPARRPVRARGPGGHGLSSLADRSLRHAGAGPGPRLQVAAKLRQVPGRACMWRASAWTR